LCRIYELQRGRQKTLYNVIDYKREQGGEIIMKLKGFLAISMLSIALAGCGQADSNDEASVIDNDNVNVKELVKDYSVGNVTDESASITSQELIVKKADGNELTYDLSDEDFFVSIAPYVDQTHP